ncbi:hypothetical protein H0H87_008352 [Tephrocybe sp. NHM501043]|nr:hypothetical protein H0H87_008352 [Tephrocybe sp. NHM501043]
MNDVSFSIDYELAKEDLWRSNTRPSQSQLSSIKASLSQAEHDIDRLKSEMSLPAIVESEARTADLLVHKQDHIDICKFLISSVRLLPSDVLIKIFEHVKQHFAKNYYFKYKPLVFCHVSSTWRAASLSHPGLWKTDPHKITYSDSDSGLLSLIVTDGPLHRVLTFVSPLYPMIFELALSNIEISAFLTLDPGTFHFLDTLRLSNTTFDRQTSITVFMGAANLRKVFINGRRAYADYLLPILPCNTLTHLYIGEDSELAAMSALPAIFRATNLQEVSFKTSLPTPLDNIIPHLNQERAVVYPQLTKFKLHVVVYRASVLKGLLALFSFSALTSFELTIVYQEYPLPLHTFATALSNSLSSIHSLSISPVLLQSVDYMNLLSACISLEDLSMPFNHAERQDIIACAPFEVLRGMAQDSFRLAKLRSFSLAVVIRNNEHRKFITYALKDLVEAWMNDAGRCGVLHTIAVTFLERLIPVREKDAKQSLLELETLLQPWVRKLEGNYEEKGFILKTTLASASQVIYDL